MYVEPGDAQRQLELQRIEQHDPEGDQPRTTWQRQSREVAGRDLDQVEPQHVVQQGSAGTETRAHQSWQQVHPGAGGPATLRRRAARQRTQFAVTLLAEQRGQLGAALTAGEQPFDVLVVQTVNRQQG